VGERNKNSNGCKAESNARNMTFHNKSVWQGQRTKFNHTNREEVIVELRNIMEYHNNCMYDPAS